MKNWKNYIRISAIALILMNAIVMQAQSDYLSDNELEQQIDSIFSEYDDINKPGIAIAVVKNDKIAFKKGYGSANLEYDIPVTTNTIFHIASVSKQFTVFSILLLENQGKLTLDDDIRKYIPELPNFGKVITLKHLATHTSGLRDQWNLLTMAGWRMDDVITTEQVFKLILNQKELNFEPGEKYYYSNTGFTLLAEVVERISGQSFTSFTEDNIFKPLKMNSTFFYDDHEKIVKNRAYSYYKDSTGYKKRVLSYATVGPTSLFTTIEDISLWIMNFSNPIIGNVDIINQMNTLAILNNGKTFGGAYGQFVGKYKGLNRISHGGADAGYRTYLGRFPDQDYSIVLFSNYAHTNSGRLAMKVTDLFLKEHFESDDATDRNSVAEFKHVKPPEAKDFIGSYWNEESMYSRKIYIKKDTLMYSRGKGNESILTPIGDYSYQMLNVDVNLIVKFKATDSTKLMIVTIDDGDPILYEYYNPANYLEDDLEEFTGTFRSDELSTSYDIVIENGKLVLKHSRKSVISLDPLKKDIFKTNKWFFGIVKFERNSKNEITGMRSSSGRVQNLYFEKVAQNN